MSVRRPPTSPHCNGEPDEGTRSEADRPTLAGALWSCALVHRRVEVSTQPTGPIAAPTYQTCQTYQPGDAVPLVLDGTTVATVPVTALLP